MAQWCRRSKREGPYNVSYEILRKDQRAGTMVVRYDDGATVNIRIPALTPGTPEFDAAVEAVRARWYPRWITRPIEDIAFEKPAPVFDRRRR
jgi:hypothetical protein